MRPRDTKLASTIYAGLKKFEKKHGSLPGIENSASRETFVEQLLESVHRVDYVRLLRGRPISINRKDPKSSFYDPLKAAILFDRDGEFDEACWQVFLAVHFGRHLKGGWRLPRDVYGRLGDGNRWGWKEVSDDVVSFKSWLDAKIPTLKGDGVKRCFSNHRKYVSLSAYSDNGTGAAVESYVAWVLGAGGHRSLFSEALSKAEQDSRAAFAVLYSEMSVVRSFGRIGKFDYLTMIGKLGLATIEPNSAYIKGSTGPIKGAQLLFDEASGEVLDSKTQELGDLLQVNMQVMEDALCNWQKSPDTFVAFRG